MIVPRTEIVDKEQRDSGQIVTSVEFFVKLELVLRDFFA